MRRFGAARPMLPLPRSAQQDGGIDAVERTVAVEETSLAEALKVDTGDGDEGTTGSGESKGTTPKPPLN